MPEVSYNRVVEELISTSTTSPFQYSTIVEQANKKQEQHYFTYKELAKIIPIPTVNGTNCPNCSWAIDIEDTCKVLYLDRDTLCLELYCSHCKQYFISYFHFNSYTREVIYTEQYNYINPIQILREFGNIKLSYNTEDVEKIQENENTNNIFFLNLSYKPIMQTLSNGRYTGENSNIIGIINGLYPILYRNILLHLSFKYLPIIKQELSSQLYKQFITNISYIMQFPHISILNQVFSKVQSILSLRRVLYSFSNYDKALYLLASYSHTESISASTYCLFNSTLNNLNSLINKLNEERKFYNV